MGRWVCTECDADFVRDKAGKVGGADYKGVTLEGSFKNDAHDGFCENFIQCLIIFFPRYLDL